MNFTREPIIETVITPREGCKLVVRNSKGNGQEDYFVDAVEVVSFGHSFFFRSSERPKPFLVPVGDYEVLELKETRMVLKNVSTDRSIKIGGGREAPMRPQRDQPPSNGNGSQDVREEATSDPSRAPMPQDRSSQDRPPQDRKRDKRRRGRRGRDRQEPHSQEMRDRPLPIDEPNTSYEESPLDQPPVVEEERKAPSFISKLFPPPSTLIRDTLSRYKPAESAEESSAREEKVTFEETVFEQEEHRISSEGNPETEDDDA